MSLTDPRTGKPITPDYERVVGIITKNLTTVLVGVFSRFSYVFNVRLDVVEAFDGSGSNNIEVGYDTDQDAYMVAEAVGSTGVKSPTLGSGVGYDTTARRAKAYYLGTSATVGKVLVIIEVYKVPKIA